MQKKVIIAQLVTGGWIIGEMEANDPALPGVSVELPIINAHDLMVHPTPDGRAQVALMPYGFPIGHRQGRETVRMFPGHAFLQFPEEAPKQFADMYLQQTSGIQLASPQQANHLNIVR